MSPRLLAGRRLPALGLAAAIAVAVPDASRAVQRGAGEITVFAAASLTGAFTEAGAAVARRNPGVTVRLNFAGSQQLAFQLQQGAGADVFASADQRWMRAVADAGLIKGDPRVFARNRLVVITPPDDPGHLRELRDLQRPRLRLVLAAAAVPAGRYSREALARLARAPGFGPDYPARVLRNVVSEEENVEAVVAKVRLGEADAGIVYASDVTAPGRSGVRVLEIPDPYNPTATYPICILKASAHPEAARSFVAFLLSADGQALLERWGFLPAGPGDGGRADPVSP